MALFLDNLPGQYALAVFVASSYKLLGGRLNSLHTVERPVVPLKRHHLSKKRCAEHSVADLPSFMSICSRYSFYSSYFSGVFLIPFCVTSPSMIPISGVYSSFPKRGVFVVLPPSMPLPVSSSTIVAGYMDRMGDSELALDMSWAFPDGIPATTSERLYST